MRKKSMPCTGYVESILFNVFWIPASLENTPNISLPLAGGDEGEGEQKLLTPTLSLPHRKGEGNKLNFHPFAGATPPSGAWEISRE